MLAVGRSVGQPVEGKHWPYDGFETRMNKRLKCKTFTDVLEALHIHNTRVPQLVFNKPLVNIWDFTFDYCDQWLKSGIISVCWKIAKLRDKIILDCCCRAFSPTNWIHSNQLHWLPAHKYCQCTWKRRLQLASGCRTRHYRFHCLLLCNWALHAVMHI